MMSLKRKWLVAAGAAVLSGVLVTGAALAADADPAAGAPTEQTDSQLTAGQQEVMTKLRELRQSYMEKFKTEAQGIIDQAVADGTITQEQADRMGPGAGFGGRRGGGKGGRGGFLGGKGGGPLGGFQDLTQEEMQEKLDAAVASGKLTQAQADLMLQHWTEWQELNQDSAE